MADALAGLIGRGVKVAYVVPRYGTEVVGGAEFAARMLAERLAARPGWEVEVLTTCALDTTTWADHYPAGDGGAQRGDRAPLPLGLGPRPRLRAPQPAGPGRPGRAPPRPTAGAGSTSRGRANPERGGAAAASSDADVVAFYPYLYHPTVHGLPAVGRRAVLHPAAHDEPPLRLPLFRPVFAAAAGLVFQTLRRAPAWSSASSPWPAPASW